MKLEGTLDAFSLPDIFQLLSATKKSGTLHVRRDSGRHGAIHLREGAITGARSQVERQELGRRLVGAGLVDDATLEKAVERVSHKQGAGLGRMLADTAPLDAETVRALASEQAVDAVFDLLRWTEGEFAFVADEVDPDDLGASLTVEQIVTEARRRLDAWPSLAAVVPSPESVVVVAATALEPAVSASEWWLLALVDGRRTVGELVALSGKGEYAVVSALAGLVQRGLLEVRHAADEALGSLHRRQSLLAGLEGVPVPTAPPAPPVPVQTVTTPPPAPAPAPPAAVRAPVIPERPEPFVAPRQPEHAEPAFVRPVPVTASASSPSSHGSASHGAVDGATALQPDPSLSPSPGVALDPSVNKSLLLRLIAGVRGL